ncbi:uncharacterized protein LOC106645212 [Copidosoma floridanum]|uniref:uncharacterized protein LOC106645212 n=1 Tax=Copidosoma floridanum TaxID=29053 RepID=UPI0006C9664A|nr:uncharacterized protein LOC106645212 [Copidosoma floridanum]
MQQYQNNNPLGFTRETASLLTGLGVSNLSEFEKRDISFDDLKYLTDEDLEVLQVGDKFDYESFRKMRDNLKKKYDTKADIPADTLKILGAVRRQAEVINLYCQFLIKMSDDLPDYFIDNDTHLKASDVLVQGVDSVLGELNNLQKAVENFQVIDKEELQEVINKRQARTIDGFVSEKDEIFKNDGLDYRMILKGIAAGIITFYVIKKFILK